ncbi:chemotaxis protein CheA [bacterium]|nr:chemotaxis protein CheA [bacterium]
MSYDGFSSDQEQRDILLGFVEEGREMLDEVEPLLVDLERSADEQGAIDLEMVNTVFRLFHSLKGGAGFLNLHTISGVTHEAETLLDMFRKGTAQLTADHIDLMNRACDFIRELIEQIETEFHDGGHEEDAAEVTKQLKETIQALKNPGNTEPTSAPVPEGDQEENAAEATEPEEVQEEAGSNASVNSEAGTVAMDLEEFQLSMGPEIIKQFTSEGEENLEKAEEALLSLENDPTNTEHVQQAFRAFHSFKGNSGFLGLKDMEKLSHSAESVLEQFRGGGLSPSSKVINLILEIIDFLRNAMNSLSSGKSADIPATPGLIHLLEDFSGAKAKAPAKQPEKEVESKPAAPPPPTPEKEEPKSEDMPSSDSKKPEAKVTEEKKQEAASKTPEKPSGPLKATAKDIKPTPKPQPAKKNVQRQSVRVDVEKLDILLDLVGELVIAEAMVSQNPDIRSLDIPLERFEKSAMQLEKITRDLQDVATSIRMIPLSGTFRRMVRLVRDLSQKAGKKVDFIILGEETEVDKTVIEQITDPLIHIIRNSIDHGLETPEDRGQEGKEPTGKLTLEAKYVGGEVWISVKDDGRGLNRERIVKRASERGLFEGDPESLKDEEVWQFIFQPGFSTAEKVTDVSGRGVGMDVVRRNIENIRGKVDIRSWEGKGSEVVLRLPLTLAIIDGMIIRVGKERYTMPITAIKESIQATPEMVTETMDGQEILRIREQLIPVIRLHKLLEVETDVKRLEDGIITVVENEGRQICLLVDELIGQQQVVIKGLSGFVANHPCVSGCTILGDGDISLILDIAGVIGNSHNSSGAGSGTVGEHQIDKDGVKEHAE